jgi:hypothetical protein
VFSVAFMSSSIVPEIVAVAAATPPVPPLAHAVLVLLVGLAAMTFWVVDAED